MTKRRSVEVDGLVKQFGSFVATVTAASGLLILLVTAGLAASTAPLTVDGEHVALRAFSYAVGQWPAVVAVAGVTTLLLDVLPRATWLAWVPLVASAMLALLGGLLGVPQWIRDLGVFGNAPDVAAGQLEMGGLLVLLAIGGKPPISRLTNVPGHHV